MAKYNKPLFDSKFEAWTYGPVVTSVREKLQDIISSEDIPEIDGIDVLNDVILQYAPIPSIELSKISHNESSWINARKGLGKYDKCSNQLSEELERYKKAIAIEKHYFKKLDELNRDILCKWGDTLETHTELIEQNKKIFKHNEDLLTFNNILSTAITEGKPV